MREFETERHDSAGFVRLESCFDDVGVLREEENDFARFRFGQEGRVDRGGTDGRGGEDEEGGVLALDGGETDVGVLEVGS